MQEKNLSLPISIMVAGLLIAGAVLYTNRDTNNTKNDDEIKNEQVFNGPKAVSDSDHLMGNPNAPITVVLFDDYECPFCKKFHATTIKAMMDEFGKSGKVRLISRNLPLDALHSKARKEAEATECAADLGGNDKFWAYRDRLFEITPSNNRLDLAELPKIAEFIGLDKVKFNECLDSGKFAAKVQADAEDAQASGAQGTPFFVIIDQDGTKYPGDGAIPYDGYYRDETGQSQPGLKLQIEKLLK